MRKFFASLAALAVAATLGLTLASPAAAWASSQFPGSPSQCSGGYVGSSWYTSTVHKASTGQASGSFCVLTRPQYGAAPRYSDRTIGFSYGATYAYAESAKISSSTGGRHAWGNVIYTT